MKRSALAVALTTAVACFASPGAAAGQSSARPEAPLKDLTLEQLMEIDVAGVLRRSEPLFDAPAAVDVISADEIRQSGAATLADLLRMGAGLFVGQQNGRTWAVSARGFTTSGNKLLVLVDGRSIYTPLFSGVFWDVQDLVVEDIDHIEIIRGPGATLWGANAVNGVINIITKPASRTMEGLAKLVAGNEHRATAVVRFGDELGPSAHYRVYAKYRTLDALATADGGSAGDPLRNGQIGGRVDWTPSSRSRVTVSGDGYVAEAGLPGQRDLDLNGWHLLGRWTREFDGQGELQLQAYYDRTYRLIPAQFEERRGTWDVDVQYRLRPRGRHLVLVGGGYRTSRDETVPTPIVQFEPAARSAPLVSLFAQDEIVIRPERVDLIVGARVEKNDFSGIELQPTVRMRWKSRSRHLAWAAVSRAVRMPTRLESDVRIDDPARSLLVRGSPDFESETLVAVEGGYRLQPHTRVAVEVAAFHNRYGRLRSLEPDPGGGFVIGNLVAGRSTGAEFLFNARPTAWMRWDAVFTAFTKRLERLPGGEDPETGAREGNDPGGMFQLRGSFDLPRDVELQAFLRSVGRLPSPVVPAYTELDLRAGWWMTRDLSVAVTGRNLLHDRHPEFGAFPARSELERSVAVHVTLAF